MPTTDSYGRCVLGDWGTSRLRLFLVEAGRIVESREGPGIAALQCTPGDALLEHVGTWVDRGRSLNVFLAGMVGSRNGLHEVPYVSLPATSATWSQASWSSSLGPLNITIAAGLCSMSAERAGDVMRGEEAQIFGSMRLEPDLATGSHLLILPGTHSKWAEVVAGAVVRFRTAFTGEIYALLCEHSTLLRAAATNDRLGDRESGFDVGVQRSLGLPEGLLAALFEARTAQLLEGRSRAWAAGFLSGLLIGDEVRTLSRTYRADTPVTVLGDPQLAELYRRVLALQGCAVRVLNGDACAIEGLKHLCDRLRDSE